MAASRENADDDDDTVSAARSQRLQNIVEAYIALLAKTGDNATGQVSLETFALADAIRGQSVQKALSASSARSVAKDPALAELVRKEQDLGKQINAQLGALNNALSLERARRKRRRRRPRPRSTSCAPTATRCARTSTSASRAMPN